MKQMPIYGRIIGLKRDLTMGDFLKIDRPLEAANFPETTIKVFTENIYIPQIASYIIVVWDMQYEKPAILVLGHTLFAALKRWRADAMQDIIGKTFTILSKTNQEVVYHDLYCRGLLPLMNDKIVDILDNYMNELFDIQMETEIIE